MKSIWRKHLIICVFLGLLAVPIYFLDLALLAGGGGGNWITLDFRGLIFWTYIAWLATHVALSSIAVLSFPKSGLLGIHFGSMPPQIHCYDLFFRRRIVMNSPHSIVRATRDYEAWLASQVQMSEQICRRSAS
jgi:hypothetical protein